MDIHRKWNDPVLSNILAIRKTFLHEENEVLSRVEAKANSHRVANLLMTLPGVAEFSSLIILSEIADIDRFKTPKQLVIRGESESNLFKVQVLLVVKEGLGHAFSQKQRVPPFIERH